jgi:hypothetical protein
MPVIGTDQGLLAHHYRLTGDSEDMIATMGPFFEDPGDYQDIVEEADTVWKAELGDICCDAYTLSHTTMYVNDGGGGTAVYDSTNAAVAGGIAANALPQNSCLLVTKRTALSGRRNRGRMFLPGVQAAAITEQGTMSGSTLDAWQPKLDAYLTGVNAIVGVACVVLHGPSTHWVLVDGQPRRVPDPGPIPPATLISSLFLESTISTQRRRLRP